MKLIKFLYCFVVKTLKEKLLYIKAAKRVGKQGWENFSEDL